MLKKEPREIFAKNLNYLFAKYNVEQNILAEKLQVSSSAITEWVKCRKFPRIDKLQDIADIFNLNISELIDCELENNDTNNIFFNEISEKFGTNSVELLNYYKELNDLGKNKAIENVKDLTKIEEYTTQEEKTYKKTGL